MPPIPAGPGATLVWASMDALLVTLRTIRALPDYADLVVDLGWPGRLSDRHVWIAGSVENWDIVYAASGLTARDETFDLRIHSRVLWSTTSFAATRDRLEDLSQRIEAAVHADPCLGGVAQLATITRATLTEAVPDEKRRELLLTQWVRVATYLDGNTPG